MRLVDLQSRLTRLSAVLAGLFTLAITGRDAWQLWHPGLEPIPLDNPLPAPSAVLAFILLAGVLVLLSVFPGQRVLRPLADTVVGVVLALAVLQLAFFISGSTFSLDAWFDLPAPDSQPMTFISALSFVLASVALYVLTLPEPRYGTAAVLATLVVGVGLIFTLSHHYHSPLVDTFMIDQGRADVHSMSVHTALTFVSLGAGLLALATFAAQQDREVTRRVAELRSGLDHILSESGTTADAVRAALALLRGSLGCAWAAMWSEKTGEPGVLRLQAALHEPGERLDAFEAACQASPLPTAAFVPTSSSGTGGQLTWINSVSDRPELGRGAACAAAGLRAYAALPLDGACRCIIELGERDSGVPSERMLEQLAALGTQLGQFLQRKKVEEERDRFFSLSLDLLCTVGFDGKLRRVNPAFERELGWPLSDLQGVPVKDFIHPDDAARVAAITDRLKAGEPVVGFESRWKCQDGSYRWLSLSCPAPPPNEQLIYAVARDVTEQRRMVEDLQAAKTAAEAANRAKSQFLANISHEIRTPMNGIIGLTDLALATDLNEEQQEYLQIIRSSGDILMRIFNDILDISKIEAGRMVLEALDLEMTDTLADTLKVFAATSQAKGLDLALRVSPHVPDALIGDAGRLRQVVVNLISNAIKFSDHGDIELNVELVEKTATSVMLQFSVRDEGIGIQPEKLGLIFEPFTQADASTARTHGGTGLGLTIAAQLVELMGGRIWVESTPGVGTTFFFTARFDLQMGPKATRSLPPLERLVGMRALVVDDSPAYRQLLQDFLSQWRIQPQVVSTADAALNALEEASEAGQPIDLLILDTALPGMDGFSLCEHIRQRSDWDSTTILMLLASAGWRGDATRCRELGISAYLRKPIRPNELLAAILTVLGFSPAERRRHLVTTHSLRAYALQVRRNMRILLVENDLASQKLAMALLERHGHDVTLVTGGPEALATVEKTAFDAVLMDLQMPRMDGLEVARRIREREQGTLRHLPILALTAAVSEDDREACYQAGMDGYLTKPLQAGRLFAALERVCPPVPGEPDVPETPEPVVPMGVASPPTRPEDPAVSRDTLLARVQNDVDTLHAMIDLFSEKTPEILSELEAALTSGETARAGQLAHDLKGSMGIYGGKRAVAYAAQLERMARNDDLGDATRYVECLRVETARMRKELRDIAADYANPV